MYLWQNNKNMEEKYYTPKIEEFHFGFEFESNCSMKPNDENRYDEPSDTYYSYKVETNTVCSLFELLLDYNGLEGTRVKYLDTKDIESFGWIEDKGFLLDDSTWFKLNSNYLRHYYHGELYIQNGNKEMIFNGVCKNKSELKRVLKQIGFKQLK